MRTDLYIRTPEVNDALEISTFVCQVANDCLGADANVIVKTISPATVKSNLQNPNYAYVLGYVGQELAGVAAIREKKHVYHLFVAPKHHNQGIAKSLWHFLKAEAVAKGASHFTVNSSLYAVPVYQKFGFSPISEPQFKNGIRYVPMQLTVVEA
jgi:GNAT superfamily N-acetyltransferase